MRRPFAVLLVGLSLLACTGDDPLSADDDEGAGASGAGSGSGAGPGGTEPANVAGITAAHNAARAAVQTSTPLPPLVWSATVAQTAQAYADVLASQGCNLQHSDGPYGENLASGSGGLTAQQVVDLWMTEDPCYSGGTINDCSCTCGHYTQIVWRESTELGCGVGQCGNGQVWVCNYNPPGNFIGEAPF